MRILLLLRTVRKEEEEQEKEEEELDHETLLGQSPSPIRELAQSLLRGGARHTCTKGKCQMAKMCFIDHLFNWLVHFVECGLRLFYTYIAHYTQVARVIDASSIEL